MIGRFLARFEWMGFEGIVLVILFWQLFSLRREQRRDWEAERARESRDPPPDGPIA
jgi:hypothetical protein